MSVVVLSSDDVAALVRQVISETLAAREQAAIWYDLRSDLPLSALQIAIKRLLLESEYPGLPPVGRIRRLATEAIQRSLKRSMSSSAKMTWC